MIALTGRALRFLSSEVRGLHAAAYILAACALLSSLLALVRDRVLAHTFGASVTLDVYYAGFRIPDLIFVMLGALVSVYMLIPEITKRSEQEQKDYIDTVLAGFSALAVVVASIAAVLAPTLLTIFFPQLMQSAMGDELVGIARIMLLQPLLLGLSNIFAAITQVRHRYALYAISPLLYNIGIILGAAFLYPLYGLAGLAWGVVLGAAFHMAIQIPSVFDDGHLHRVPWLREPRALLRTALISAPRALALSMNQLAFLGLTTLAATLTAGSIAIFMFAYNLASVPLAIIGASYSVAAFPTLARAYTRGDRAEFTDLVATAARYVFFWSLPAAALILVLRAHVVRVILGSGAFDWTDTRLTAAAFALFSISLAAQGITLLLVRGYYAAGSTFVPFIVASATAAGTVATAAIGLATLENNSVLQMVERLMRVEDLSGSPVLALAFAYASVAILGTVALAVHFEYRFGNFLPKIVRALVESCIAAIGAAAGAYIFLGFASSFDVSSTALSIFGQGFAAGLCGIAVAMLAYFLLGNREYAEVYASIRGRLWRIAKQEEITLTTSAEE